MSTDLADGQSERLKAKSTWEILGLGCSLFTQRDWVVCSTIFKTSLRANRSNRQKTGSTISVCSSEGGKCIKVAGVHLRDSSVLLHIDPVWTLRKSILNIQSDWLQHSRNRKQTFMLCLVLKQRNIKVMKLTANFFFVNLWTIRFWNYLVIWVEKFSRERSGQSVSFLKHPKQGLLHQNS